LLASTGALDHGMTLLRKATNRVHNLANQLSVISFGLTTLKSRSTTTILTA
jgi:hypothetical protein